MSVTENNWPLGRIAKRRRSFPSFEGIESECSKEPTVQSIVGIHSNNFLGAL